MAKATIKSGSGATITVEGTPDEVSAIINTFEKAAEVGNAKTVVARARKEKKSEKKRDSASDLIVGFKEDGFFDKPKALGDVGAALEQRGFLYPVTTLSGVMLGLVKRRFLSRKKISGKWMYGK